MNEASEKGARCKNDRTDRNFPAIRKPNAARAPRLDQKIVGFRFDYLKVRNALDRGLHRMGIEFPVGLGARTTHSWAFATIKDPELDPAEIGNSAHEAV
jgi:hypothetical protein